MDESPPARCSVCHSTDARLRYRITRFRVYQCLGCTQIYLWPLLSEDEVREMFVQLYRSGEGSVPELKSYYDFCYDDRPSNPLVQLYESWLDEIERRQARGRLLDIGCGAGLFLAVARRRGWEPYGIDECSDATRYARDEFGLEVWDGEFSEIAGGEMRFDAITMWDIIEHARDPVGLLQSTYASLAPGGIVGVSTPNQRSILDVVAGAMYRASGGLVTRPLEKFYIEQHFLYFTPDTLEQALRRAGLESVHVRPESTDLRRLTLALPTRWLLRTLFTLGRLSGLENRIFSLARARAEPGPDPR